MAAGYQVKGNIVCYLLTKYFSILTSRLSATCLWLNSCHMGMCWHDSARIRPNIDVSKNTIYPICRGWMAAGYQMKGNIVFYLLTKYLSNITCQVVLYIKIRIKNAPLSRCFLGRQMHKLPRLNGCGVSSEMQNLFLSADEIFFSFNEPFCGNMSLTEVLSFRGLCWHGRERMHPNIDVSKNAICTICRGWMAVGFQMKGNVVNYLMTKYFSI